MLRFSAEPNHARRHSKRASLPGGKTARFPLPALDERDRAASGRLLCVPRLPDQVAGNDAVDDAEHPANQRRVSAAGTREVSLWVRGVAASNCLDNGGNNPRVVQVMEF